MPWTAWGPFYGRPKGLAGGVVKVARSTVAWLTHVRHRRLLCALAPPARAARRARAHGRGGAPSRPPPWRRLSPQPPPPRPSAPVDPRPPPPGATPPPP